jgi:hypothetical protein
MNRQGPDGWGEGDKQIAVVTRLRSDERAQLADVNNLYV